ncbi:hypothetical protein Sm713_38520 [Streptomyces sp. TS71-3]|nr:hypothetical protein Sm713_38520 [Streptomyces sp. TS71-3]
MIITLRNKACGAFTTVYATPKIEFGPLTPVRSGRLEGHPKEARVREPDRPRRLPAGDRRASR